MSDCEYLFEKWMEKNHPDVTPEIKELLRRAFMFAYFAGWEEAEKDQ